MSKQPDFRAMSEAVENWYRFYEAPPNEHSAPGSLQRSDQPLQPGLSNHRRHRDGAHRAVYRNLVYEGERADVLGNPLAQVWQP